MKKKLLSLGTALLLTLISDLSAHCQMPCGIYHDDMVFDKVDEYVETTFKGLTVMNESKFSSVKQKNEFIRWVIQKENSSSEVADLIMTYFLQQKIKPDEQDTLKKLVSAHKLLFLLVQIKQNTDVQFLETFSSEWDKFKLMFHREGYECQIEKIKLKKIAEQQKALESHADHDHDHDHTHDEDHSH